MSVTTPAVPASTIAVANPTGQQLSVAVTGGTVTSVTVNGAQVAAASPANVPLPPGASIAVTYSVVPAWAWDNYPWLAPPSGYGTAYAQENTVPASGAGGYSPLTALPYPVHAATGMSGYGAGVAN